MEYAKDIAAMIEKMLYISVIDEQLLEYKTDPGNNQLQGRLTAERALKDLRGDIKLSLQADIRRVVGENKATKEANIELRRCLDSESKEEAYERMKKPLRSLFTEADSLIRPGDAARPASERKLELF